MQALSQRRMPAALLVAGASVWMAGAGNAPLWRELSDLGVLQSQGGWLLVFALAGMMAAALHALLSLVAWRPVLKPAIVVLLFASALGAHFMWTSCQSVCSVLAAIALSITTW